MRMFALLVSLTLMLSSPNSLGAEFTIADCEVTVAEMNKDLPMSLDTVTTWTKTSCTEKPGNIIGLIYDNSVADGTAITQAELDSLLPSLIASWCFGPSLEPLMKIVDTIKYQYHFASGESIGELDFSFRDCFSKH